jgi:hypothetical protein
LIAVVAGLAVDSRLDRHWILRGLTALLAVCCAALLATDQTRRLRQILTGVGLGMFGLIIPVSQTAWSKPPEIDFALQVATDAKNAAQKNARSAVSVADVQAAAEARGGAVGTLPTEKNPQARGADATRSSSAPSATRAAPGPASPSPTAWTPRSAPAEPAIRRRHSTPRPDPTGPK